MSKGQYFIHITAEEFGLFAKSQQQYQILKNYIFKIGFEYWNLKRYSQTIPKSQFKTSRALRSKKIETC